VRDRINELVTRLEAEGELSFFSCFRFLREEVTAEEARHEAVVTFLAILEMAKLGLLTVSQPEQVEADRPDGPDGPDGIEEDIFIRRVAVDLPGVDVRADSDYR
jgi:hypothetical protein